MWSEFYPHTIRWKWWKRQKGIYKVKKEIGFTRIGKYPDGNFVHLDNREQECYWVKYRNYRYIGFEVRLGA